LVMNSGSLAWADEYDPSEPAMIGFPPDQSFNPQAAPYDISQLVEPGTGWRQSAPIVTADGDSISAAVVSNLPGYAICLLIDIGNDGLIDEVLPTGISSGYSPRRWEAAGV